MKFQDLDIDLIIEELKQTYNSEHKSFDAFKFSEILIILLSHVKSSEEISFHSRERLIRKALQRFHKEEITKENFYTFLDEALKEYTNIREQNYTLLTSLSIDYLPIRKIQINHSKIQIHGKNFPKKFRKSRKLVLERNRKKEGPSKFLKVTVQLKGKNYLDVFDQACYDLNIFRAILCFHLNPFSELPISNDSNRTINTVRNGEFYTLHNNEDGSSVDENIYWFEPSLYKSLKRFPYEETVEYKRSILAWIFKLKKSKKKHQKKLFDVLNLYVNAFDEKDKHTSFLKGWTALESLLDTHDNQLIIKRCLSVFKKGDRGYQKAILEGLRNRRNLFVHENDTKINSLINCYHVQNYIYSLIRANNLRFYKEIENIQEANELLDYRRISNKEISSKRKLLRQVSSIKRYES